MASEDSDRQQISRMGGLARSARAVSGAAVSAPARAGFLKHFYDETDPALPEPERQRQAAVALRLHMTRLSRNAARKRSQAARAAVEAEAATNAEIAALRGDFAV